VSEPTVRPLFFLSDTTGSNSFGVTGKHHKDALDRLKSSGIVKEAHELKTDDLFFTLESKFSKQLRPQRRLGENLLHVGIYPRVQEVVEMAQDDVPTSERAFNSTQFPEPSDAATQHGEIAQASASNTLASNTLASNTLASNTLASNTLASNTLASPRWGAVSQDPSNGICNPKSSQASNNPTFSVPYDTAAMWYSETAHGSSNAAYVDRWDAGEDTPGPQQFSNNPTFSTPYDTAAMWYSETAHGSSNTAYVDRWDAGEDTLGLRQLSNNPTFTAPYDATYSEV
jgi:hypothetical protein